MFQKRHLLGSSCHQTISRSSAEAELHAVVTRTAWVRGVFFIRSVLQAMEVIALVRVGMDSSFSVGFTQRLGADRARHEVVKDLYI